MKDQERAAKVRKIETIIRNSMGGFYTWEKPQLTHSMGPVFPDAFDEIQKQIDNVKHDFTEYLTSMDSDQSQDLFDDDGKLLIRPMTDETGWVKFNLEKIRYLRKSMPVWFASGFGVKEYSADIDYWDKFPVYKSRELLCLSVGIDPRKIDLDEILSNGRKSNSTQPLIKFLEDRYTLLARKFNLFKASEWSVSQEEFFNWADDVNFDVYEPFLKSLREIYQPTVIKQEIDLREKTSLLQIIFVMAMDCYKFDPKSKRIGFAKELEERAALNGIQISRETIRNHLKSAGEFYNGEWKHD
jgi:hypothetical protein